MRHTALPLVLAGAGLAACAPGATRVSLTDRGPGDGATAVAHLLDEWHAAAARSDAEAYFARMTERAVFLGTDADERWDKAAFVAYATPHFADGRGWTFRAVRRDVVLHRSGELAWFDEDLATENLGPARGSGVAVRGEDGRWRIAQYNLALTIPNERLPDARAILEAGDEGSSPAPTQPPDAP